MFREIEVKEFPYDDNYLVYDSGEIFDKKNNKFVNYTRMRNGTTKVEISGKLYDVHKVIALTFLPNSNNYECINHKDTVKSHNFIENLEWCTKKYALNYKRYLNDEITKEELESYL